MITAIDIQNIQSHEKTNLIFHQGVNVIIGPSDSGKTGILRSIRLAVWNRPSGTSLCSLWGGTSFVRLYTEEGSISRYKGKVDKYVLNIRGKEKQEFKAVRTGVPDEINQFLNISEINLQRQLDSPFLLSNTAGEVAKHFNQIANLNKIDSATSNINSSIRELGGHIRFTEQQIIQYTKELESFKHLEKVEIELEVLEDLEKELKRKKNTREKLFSWCISYQEVNTAIDFESDLFEYEEPIDSILALYAQKIKTEKTRKKLWSLVCSINLATSDIEYEKRLSELEQPVNTILDLYSTMYEKDKKNAKLLKLIVNLKQINLMLDNNIFKVIELTKKFDKEFPDVCPLCNKPK